MLNKESILGRFKGITEGTPVYTNDGAKLGKVAIMGDDHFVVQKGIFFPKDFTLRYADIQNVRDDSIYLNFKEDYFNEWKDDSYTGWDQTDDLNVGRLHGEPLDEYKDRYAHRTDDLTSSGIQDEVKVPLVEEELEATKTSRQTGEITVRKVAHTEFKHFRIPVTREEVRVERVPVSGESHATDASFKDETVRVPVMEEEVTVTKRPVVREEVRVTKERTTEERDISGEVRKEEVQIEGEKDLKRRKAS